jgi:surface antigen
MKHKLVSVVLVLTLVSALSGCQSTQGVPEEHRGAATGAGVGAATGAVAATVLGKDADGVVIGSLLGALIGGAIGHYFYDRQRTREETAKTYDYEASRGTILTIEEASALPQKVRPGDIVELKMTYAVLNPAPETRTTITEIREIRQSNELVGQPEVRVDRSDGTYTSTLPLRLPASAKKGTYVVRTVVQSANAKDTKEIRFSVE